MVMGNGGGLRLDGPGACYIRVSDDKQDAERQINSVKEFQAQHGVKIPTGLWFEDHGWERDADETRPAFNRLLSAVRQGDIRWIVVNRIDRFGAKSAKRLLGYLGTLEEAGCALYDVSGKEWTGEDDATEIQAWLAGTGSVREQREKSYRSLDGMATGAKNGEHQGGPPPLGFDLGVFDRATGAELWRFVFEGRDVVGTETRRGERRPKYSIRRPKVYPDGRSERFDGTSVEYRTNKDAQVLRITPTRDKAKLDAVRAVFRRYATENISFAALAKWLNDLGVRNAFGGRTQGKEVLRMLGEHAYIGHPTFNKRTSARFNRLTKAGLTQIDSRRKGTLVVNDPDDVVRSDRQFYPPLIDLETWYAVRKKLGGREKATPAPRNPEMYLAGLVYCKACGAPMQAQGARREYVCGTWDRHRVHGNLAESPCLRNGVKQELLERYVERWLAESATTLRLVTEPLPGGNRTARLEEQELGHWREFVDGISRLTRYLVEHHPAAYNEILRRQEEEHPFFGPDDFVYFCVQAYRDRFDPSEVEAAIARLKAEEDALAEKWADAPTERVRAKAAGKLKELEARIGELERQREDLATVVEESSRQSQALQTAIAGAAEEMRGEAGPVAFRRRAEALAGVIFRIECAFAPVVGTGKRLRSKLTKVRIDPVVGDATVVFDGERGVGGARGYGEP